eukprot:g2062.t1
MTSPEKSYAIHWCDGGNTSSNNRALPTLISVAPSIGPSSGGQLITLTGQNFGDINPGSMLEVTINGLTCDAPATATSIWINSTTAQCITPAQIAQTLDNSLLSVKIALLSQDGGASATKQFSSKLCPTGTFANLSKIPFECSACAAGSYSDVKGLSACKACVAGQARAETSSTTQEDRTKCEDCAVGKFASGSAMKACTECHIGWYNANLGQKSCKMCPLDTYNLKLGSSGERSASCLNCPAGGFCPGGPLIFLEQGYWRTTKFSASANLYKCDDTGWNDRCSGLSKKEIVSLRAALQAEEIDVSKYGHDQYTLVDEGAADTTNGKWSLSLVAAEMKVTSGTCGLGAVGVLCHACDASAGFVPGDSGGACILCNNALDVTTTQIVLLAVGTPLLFMILFIFFIKRAPSQMKDPNDIKSSDRIHHLRHELSRHVESPEKLFESMIRCGDDTNDLKSGGVYKEDDVDREMKKAFEDADASSDDDDDQKDVSRRGMGFSSRGEELFVGRKEFKHILLQQIYSEAAHRERLLRKGIREKKKKLGKEGSTKWSE